MGGEHLTAACSSKLDWGKFGSWRNSRFFRSFDKSPTVQNLGALGKEGCYPASKLSVFISDQYIITPCSRKSGPFFCYPNAAAESLLISSNFSSTLNFSNRFHGTF